MQGLDRDAMVCKYHFQCLISWGIKIHKTRLLRRAGSNAQFTLQEEQQRCKTCEMLRSVLTISIKNGWQMQESMREN